MHNQNQTDYRQIKKVTENLQKKAKSLRDKVQKHTKENQTRNIEQEYQMEISKESQPKDKKIASLKSLLKEENPQKLKKIIERLEESEEKIDAYVARITGINIKSSQQPEVGTRSLKRQ